MTNAYSPERVHADHSWLHKVQEEIIDPERPIIDPHHHLWERSNSRYLLEDFWEDTGSGHAIAKTVFIECYTNYRSDGPEHLRSLGETAFARDQALQSRSGSTEIGGIVAYADLRHSRLDEIVDAHVDTAEGLLRGFRQAGAHEPQNDFLFIKPRQPAGLYLDADFQRGVRFLGQRGLTYDTWHYHHQNHDFMKLVAAAPDTLIILDHFGTPLGVGPYADRREEIYEQWKRDIEALARFDNLVLKLGGLAMPDNGFGWNRGDTPPSSDEFVAAQRRYYLHALDCFGPERCMFESNFPVDKWSLSYHVLWNGLKKMVADFSDSEKDSLFYQTAARVYRL